MKLTVLFSILFLSGCVAAIPKFPEAPSVGMEKCPVLSTVNDDVKLSELMKTVNKNYTEYYVCGAKVDTWIEWYQKQKKLNDDALKQK